MKNSVIFDRKLKDIRIIILKELVTFVLKDGYSTTFDRKLKDIDSFIYVRIIIIKELVTFI